MAQPAASLTFGLGTREPPGRPVRGKPWLSPTGFFGTGCVAGVADTGIRACGLLAGAPMTGRSVAKMKAVVTGVYTSSNV
jgi:hypothetical protein